MSSWLERVFLAPPHPFTQGCYDMGNVIEVRGGIQEEGDVP